MSLPSIDIVILNYNTKSILEQCLPQVIANSQYPNCKIVIVDNASTDDSAQFVKTTYPNLELVILDSNTGFAGGYNRGLKGRTSDYFVLLNSDAEPEKGWMEPLLEMVKLYPNLGACQPKIIDYFNRTKFEYAGAAGGYIDEFGYPFCMGRIFGNVEFDKGQYNQSNEIFWASGAAMFIKREAWEMANGLDEDFFAHMEEIDLCWRLQLLGYKIYNCHQSTFYHMGGATLSNQNPRKTYLNFRNSLLMLYKNLPDSIKAKRIFQRKIFDGLAAFLFLIQGKPKHIVQILKAHQYFDTHKKNFQVSSNPRDIQTLSGVLKNSLVIGYFLYGKKTWNNWFKNH